MPGTEVIALANKTSLPICPFLKRLLTILMTTYFYPDNTSAGKNGSLDESRHLFALDCTPRSSLQSALSRNSLRVVYSVSHNSVTDYFLLSLVSISFLNTNSQHVNIDLFVGYSLTV